MFKINLSLIDLLLGIRLDSNFNKITHLSAVNFKKAVLPKFSSLDWNDFKKKSSNPYNLIFTISFNLSFCDNKILFIKLFIFILYY